MESESIFGSIMIHYYYSYDYDYDYDDYHNYVTEFRGRLGLGVGAISRTRSASGFLPTARRISGGLRV